VLDEFLALVDQLDMRSQVIMHVRREDLTLEESADEMGCSERTMKRLWEALCRKCRAIREREEQRVEDVRKEGTDNPEAMS
jgi:DNA-directed RNA polymerase specialized sigma24 family protein